MSEKNKILESQLEHDGTSKKKDRHYYQMIINTLEKPDPGHGLPSDFSKKVMLKAMSSRVAVSDFSDWVMLWVSAFGFLMISIIGLTYYKIELDFFTALMPFRGYLITALVLIAAIQWLDKKVIYRAGYSEKMPVERTGTL